MQAQRFIAEGIEVWCLEDGTKSFDAATFPALDDATRAARLAAAGLQTMDTAFNVYLLRHPDGAVDLVDAGCGTLFGAGAGHLPARMADLGVAAEHVRTLIFTHLHGDHCGGAVLDGKPAFPNAQVLVHPADIAHFGAGEGPASVMLNAYAGRITPMTDGHILPGGLRVWHLPGHTPGHCGLHIGDGFALVADILHSFAVQLPDPGLGPRFDVDAAQAAQSRRAALDWLADTGAVWSGSHGIGARFLRAQRDGRGFRTVPA
ncbi:MBL fold metallo-hydrolase [Thetidibacter halocola]|uniref:MBL fold metallo-hydrolase n=1 Tax=Thetidibacter halocola TaxID=2827239 RepID=A0A8J7W7Z6_9RHOB|nr:MBL fold metallo-hydrolase [Thetidibacter halocola]MBS0122650.1 MBL fold metallo-hydrolase [Thetidibacter halocola]